MIIKDEVLLTANPDRTGPVPDGLQLWIDGRDGIDGVDTNTTVFSGAIHDRITGESITFNDSLYRTGIRSDGNKFIISGHGAYGAYNTGILQNGARYNLITHEMVLDKKNRDVYRSRLGVFLDWTSNNDYVSFHGKENGSGISALIHGMSANTPCHILATYGDGEVHCYNNGILLTTKTYTGEILPSFSDFFFRIDSGSKLRDVYDWYSYRAYDRILTPEEIRQNYEYEKSLGRVE